MSLLSVTIVAIAVFMLPGLLLNWVSGARGPWSIAAAVPSTFAIYGLAAWVYGLTPYHFEVKTVAVFWAGVMLLALLWRGTFIAYRRRARRALTASTAVSDTTPAETDELETTETDASGIAEPASRSSHWRVGTLLDPVWLLPGIGSIAGAYLILSRSLKYLSASTNGMNNIYQGWDVHWHASVMRWIMETGIASPTRMGELQNAETQAKMYYPSAWHAGGALLREIADISPIAATNLTGLILPGLMLPLSAAAIAWRLINNRGLTAQIAAGFAALIVPGIPALYWVGQYVGAWPYLAAIAAAGSVLGLFMSVPYSPIRSFATALAFIGLVQIHPSSVTMPVLGLALWWLLYLLWRPSRRPATWKGQIGFRLRDIGLLAVPGIIGALTLLPQILLGAEQTEDVKSVTALEDLTREESWRSAIFMYTRHTNEFHMSVEPWVWVALVGAVLLLLWRRNLWAPVFWGLSVWITANALTPFGDGWDETLGLIGALHYNTAHRLVMQGALFVVAGAAVALAIAIRLVTGGPIKKLGRVSSIGALILAVIGGGIVQHVAVAEIDRGAQWSINSARDERMVSNRDLKAFDWLKTQPHAQDGQIFSNPDEGSGWMYAYNALPATYRHYLWPQAGIGTSTNTLFFHPMRLGAGNFDVPDENNFVDLAAANLNVKYIYISPPKFWHFQWDRPDMEFGFMETPGLTPVYRDKEIGIYAVNAAFTDEELIQIRANSPSPDPLPPLKTYGELGKAETYEQIDKPFIHRPTIPNRGRDSHFEWLEARDKAPAGTAQGSEPKQVPSPADVEGNASGATVSQ
ncbi:hypothetical protein QVA66_05685 [Staphylococcus chromogenes]|nr:hypothetical protein [Staphylococcus chromogenes]